MFTARSGDGVSVIAHDEGQGPVILVVGPGSDDGSSWAKVSSRLASRFRVLRVHRRQYRLDLDNPDGFPMSKEAEDIVALVTAVGVPVLVVGHSSGGVAALEALVVSPASFIGAVLYEPPVTVHGEPWDGPLAKATAAFRAGKPGAAMRIFARDIVRTPAWVAWAGGALVGIIRKYRELVPGQIFDTKAIHDLGIRLPAYGTIGVPVLLVSGERSPKHLGERIDELQLALPQAEKVVLRKQGHTANQKAPADLAALITAFYEKLLHGRV
ncbi:alpha/beta fold hydrolase [Arthrobacter sp. ISL-95]|uniref:alpha/beta fold hydrolase n=1 Tax=Arthrobacter sp. ISL-95 TaxID=2819116 RepID=UPI001BEAC83E|nr:alpha/beta hydrolase [Arthrobacter sp. ISL-95]MBT2585929.1 alpha/beta hydrolase [Arthrobacter sp. ISL-95]